MEDKKFVPEARSDHNGIAFHSQKYDFFYVISQTEKGKISKYLLQTLEESEVYKIKDNTKKHPIQFCLLFLGILLFLTMLTQNIGFFNAGFYFLIFCYDRFSDFCIIFWIMHFDPIGRTTAQFHAAEHMVVNAYEKYQRVPTLQEIEASSPFSKNCGSLFTIHYILFTLINSIFFGLLVNLENPILYIVMFSLTNIFFFIGKKYSWFRFLEILVIRKPSKKQLRLARQGIRFFDETEALFQKLEKDPTYAKYFEKID